MLKLEKKSVKRILERWRSRYVVRDRHGAALCGTSRVLFLDTARRLAWMYACPTGPRPWVDGLAYRRELWERQRFAPVRVGEDTRFACAAGNPLALP